MYNNEESKTKMVEIPMIDGTTREVEEGTTLLVQYSDGSVAGRFAVEGGYRVERGSNSSSYVTRWDEVSTKVKAVLIEDDTPFVEIEVPQRLGAIIGDAYGIPRYVRAGRHLDGSWVGAVFSGARMTDAEMKNALCSRGYKVLFDGVEDFAEKATETSSEVKVPTKIGAVVIGDGSWWRAVCNGNGSWYSNSGALWEQQQIADLLKRSQSTRVIFEGVDG